MRISPGVRDCSIPLMIYTASITTLSLREGFGLVSRGFFIQGLPFEKISVILKGVLSGIQQLTAYQQSQVILVRLYQSSPKTTLLLLGLLILDTPSESLNSSQSLSTLVMKKYPRLSVAKYFAKDSKLRVADIIINLLVFLFSSVRLLRIFFRATKQKSISKLLSWISSRTIWVQGRSPLKRSCWIRMPQVMQMIEQLALSSFYIPIWQPTFSPSLVLVSFATRTARLVAATLRGWQMAILAEGLSCHMALGTWVDLPQPVFPLTMVTGLFLMSARMSLRCLVMGS